MSTLHLFLVAMFLIYLLPIIIWKFGKTDFYAPLVTIQILVGIILGPGILGYFFHPVSQLLFNHSVISLLNGLAYWGVMLFVFLAGLELDFKGIKNKKKDTLITNILAIGFPLLFGGFVAFLLQLSFPDLLGMKAKIWQFILGIGMATAVTALPILLLFMEKLNILRRPIGQRVLRYASFGDIFLWGILAIILMEWSKLFFEIFFLIAYLLIGTLIRRWIQKLNYEDKMYFSLIWLIACALLADLSGMHFMVGAFLAGAILDIDWFKKEKIDSLRFHVLILLMPIFFLITGLKTNWQLGGYMLAFVAIILFLTQLTGKIIGLSIAGIILKWKRGESLLIAWLLQTKALIEIIFANILLDKQIISDQMFTSLLLMALISTMLTIPMVKPKLKKLY